jgi:RNA recognition motif-containing protein
MVNPSIDLNNVINYIIQYPQSWIWERENFQDKDFEKKRIASVKRIYISNLSNKILNCNEIKDETLKMV